MTIFFSLLSSFWSLIDLVLSRIFIKPSFKASTKLLAQQQMQGDMEILQFKWVEVLPLFASVGIRLSIFQVFHGPLYCFGQGLSPTLSFPLIF